MPQLLAPRTSASSASLTEPSYAFDTALSTVFTPPSSCSLAAATNVASITHQSGCLPTNYPEHGPGVGHIYSPGKCPSGYSTFTLQDGVPEDAGGMGTLVITTVDVGETAVVCCPGGYTWPTSTTTNSLYGYCQSLVQSTMTREDSIATGTAETFYAEAIQIRWKDTDFRKGTEAAANTDNGIHSSSGGLSKGARIGIGVGVAVAGLLILAALSMFIFLRRRRRSGVATTASTRQSKQRAIGGHRKNVLRRRSAGATAPIRGRPTTRRSRSEDGNPHTDVLDATAEPPNNVEAYPIELESRSLSPGTINRLLARKSFLTQRMNSLRKYRRKPTPILEDDEEEEVVYESRPGGDAKGEEITGEIHEDWSREAIRSNPDVERGEYLEELGSSSTEEGEMKEKKAWMDS